MGSSRADMRLLPSGHGEVKPRACCDVATPAVDPRTPPAGVTGSSRSRSDISWSN